MRAIAPREEHLFEAVVGLGLDPDKGHRKPDHVFHPHGLDPLHVANEGKCLVVVDQEDCENVLKAMKNDESGRNAKIIGSVTRENPGKVFMKTRIGGTRILSMLAGEQLPRIC